MHRSPSPHKSVLIWHPPKVLLNGNKTFLHTSCNGCVVTLIITAEHKKRVSWLVFTLHLLKHLFTPTPSWLPWGVFSHRGITVWSLFIHNPGIHFDSQLNQSKMHGVNEIAPRW